MKRINGDIVQLALDGRIDVLVHGCNCFNVMGAGLASQIAEVFPEAREVDSVTPKGDKNKLGDYSSVQITRLRTGNQPIIINAYTQYRYGGNKVHLDYDALQSCFRKIKEDFGGQGLKIAYPLIGCGLAGGNWAIASRIIDKELAREEHYVVFKT